MMKGTLNESHLSVKNNFLRKFFLDLFFKMLSNASHYEAREKNKSAHKLVVAQLSMGGALTVLTL